MTPADSGISGESAPTGNTLDIIMVFLSIALYNVAELNFIILATFKRRSGLYFWSFIVATWGIAPYAIGFLIKALQLGGPAWGYVTLIVVGWCCMVTGQSFVLYSRVHIVLGNESHLRFVLGMIVTNAIICHVPIIVMVYGANSANPDPFIGPYSIMERIQVTLFFLQETIISALYIHETVALMRVRRRAGILNSGRRLMTHLVVVNIIIVVLDVTILALEYASLYDLQTAYKALVYSLKLKLEFSILNRLVEMTTGSSSADHSSYAQRTRVDLSGVELETQTQTRDRDRQRKKAADNMGNSVFVGSGPGEDAAEAKAGVSVMMTTEISIQRDRIRSDSAGQADLESMSIGERSVDSAGDSTLGGAIGKRRAPSHSSEHHIVEPRY
ncbi:hypothetical protein C8A01DRAFT_17455 [Parachaetomium inaequale]|uniref:DUF7703 domain-containing protein n=1 Tax=Parachaetomium inaequale TaxID=2588326 RepID=A0AAN6SQ45_9PEZI|nr:hypothetical protein C8A01DRAFT_17455 [Parachaetomium inaequale]